MQSIHSFDKRKLRGASSQNSTLPHRSPGYAVPMALASLVLILSGCGGGGSDNSNEPPAMDAEQNPFDPVQGEGTGGALVPDGQFAGLDQACVDMLLDLNPNGPADVIQLTCRPENIEGPSKPADMPPVATPGEQVPATPPPVVLTPPPITTPPTAAPGLNVAPADVAGGSYYQNSRSSALLTGPLFGTGARPNLDLVKPLSVRIDSIDPNLRLLEMRAIRDDRGGSNADYLGIVQNTGTEFVCSVGIREITEFSSTGLQLASGDALDFALLSGEVGVRPGDTFYFPSCLAPGNLGYMTSFRDVNYDDVAELRTESLRASQGLEPVDGIVLPVSYAVQADGSLSVTLVNNHNETLEVFGINTIAIDEQGHAFAWNSRVSLTEVAPGAEFIVERVFPGFQGRASTIRVIVNYDLP